MRLEFKVSRAFSGAVTAQVTQFRVITDGFWGVATSDWRADPESAARDALEKAKAINPVAEIWSHIDIPKAAEEWFTYGLVDWDIFKISEQA